MEMGKKPLQAALDSSAELGLAVLASAAPLSLCLCLWLLWAAFRVSFSNPLG
jgi:hypothetical protein